MLSPFSLSIAAVTALVAAYAHDRADMMHGMADPAQYAYQTAGFVLIPHDPTIRQQR